MSYKAMYLKIFNRVTDVERRLMELAAELQSIQQECEDMYIESKGSISINPVQDE